MRVNAPLVTALVVALVLVACGQAAPAQPTQVPGTAPTSAILGATAVGTTEAHFNPTEGVGGGSLGSSAVTDVTSVFASVPQATQLQLAATSTPPGATGADIQAVSVIAQDKAGVLKSLDATGKKALGDALLAAAAAAWPNATISLLVTDAGGGGTIIGSRPKGGPNTVIAT